VGNGPPERRRPQGEVSAEVDPVPQRCDVGDRLQRGRQLRHREEGAREEEHGDDAEPEDGDETDIALSRDRERRDRRCEGEAGQDPGWDEEHRQWRLGRPEQRHHDEEDCARHRHSQGDPREMAHEHVSHAQRRREHGVVGLQPLHGGHHRPRRLHGTCLHGAGGQQGRSEEHEVGDAAEPGCVPAVDQRAETEPHRGEEEHGLEHTRNGRPPPRALVAVAPGLQRADGRRGHQSTSVRPVRWRKTSSSVLRRTSALAGCTPSA